MRDLTRSQIRTLFELSNGQRLFVREDDDIAYISSEGGQRDDGEGATGLLQNVRTLRENECLVHEGRLTVDGVGEVDRYGISAEGIERLLDSSMRPEEN